MNQEAADTPRPEAERPLFEWTRWKVVTFSIAGVLVAAGLVLGIAGVGGSADEGTLAASGPVGATPAGAGAKGLLPGTLPGGTTEPEDVETPPAPAEEGSDVTWSPALLRGGISFFAAFALAFAFRSFLRIALIIVGIWAGAMFYLSYLGWIEVHWDVIDAAFNTMTANIGEQFKSVQTFITGSLPSAGMGGLGLYTGFRRK